MEESLRRRNSHIKYSGLKVDVPTQTFYNEWNYFLMSVDFYNYLQST